MDGIEVPVDLLDSHQDLNLYLSLETFSVSYLQNQTLIFQIHILV